MPSIVLRSQLYNFDRAMVMGILNITPDSFYDGGQYNFVEHAIARAATMIEEGAQILDVGGMSSRPGAEQISIEEECARLIPVIKTLRLQFPDIILSVDTFRAAVAECVLDLEVDMINDISGTSVSDAMLEVLKKYDAAYCMMHMQGDPQTMQSDPSYDHVVLDIIKLISLKVNELKNCGIDKIIIDPGFGFGKTVQHNYQLLQDLNLFSILDLPVLVGLSRKSMIYKPLKHSAKAALNGTTALHMAALERGANILRVHDVKEAAEVIELYSKLKSVKS